MWPKGGRKNGEKGGERVWDLKEKTLTGTAESKGGKGKARFEMWRKYCPVVMAKATQGGRSNWSVKRGRQETLKNNKQKHINDNTEYNHNYIMIRMGYQRKWTSSRALQKTKKTKKTKVFHIISILVIT